MRSARGQRLDVGGGVTVEYMRRQGLVRVDGPSARVELPLSEFMAQLGVQPADLCPSRQYLLFGGHDDRPSGGMADLIEVYADEQEARAAFQRLRLASGSGPAWAHLVAMERGGGVERLCWFGPEAHTSPVPSAAETEASRRSWRARRKRSEPPPPASPPPPRPPQRSGSAEPPTEDTSRLLAAFSSRPPDATPRSGFPWRPPGPIPPRGGRRRR